MYRFESWTIKKAEHQRIDAFELWCWRRLLRVPWIARRSNQSILKESSPGCSLEGLMLKLKLQYFGHLMWRADLLEILWCWERLGARGEGTTEDEMAEWHHWLDGRESVNSRSWWWTGRPGLLWFMGLQRVGHDWATELNWTEVCHSFYSKEQASFNFVAVVNIHSDFGAQENKVCHCSIVSPSISHEMMGLDAMIFIFWMLSFKSAFSLSSYTFIKRLFSSSSVLLLRWYHLHIWGYWYFSW